MEHVIAIAGDIYIKREGPSSPFRATPIASANFAYANLEGALTTVPEQSRFVRPWSPKTGFRMNPKIVEDLHLFSAVSVANNHAFDFNVDGYLDSIAALDAAGVKHSGGGVNVSAAREPVITDDDGLKVAFLAYSCLCVDNADATETRGGMAKIKIHTSYEMPLRGFEQPGSPAIVRTSIDEESRTQLESAIEAVRDAADVVVVSIHWGVNGGRMPVEYQKALGHFCIDSGADIVFGHHPHVLQEIEIYKERPICYSMGNLVFDGDRHSHDGRTAVARVYVEDKKLKSIGVTPYIPDADHNPVPCEEDVAKEIIAALFPTALDDGEWIEGEFAVRLAQ